MPELTSAGLTLFLIICGEFVLFFVMNGSDFGAGIATTFAKNPVACHEIMRVPWPVWFGNETWWVVAIGTMLGTFPHWYANLASGWYPAFILTLACLILRGLSFDCHMQWRQKTLNEFWNKALVVASVLPPFLIGMIFASTLQGVPIVNGVAMPGFLDVVTPFSVVSGILLVLLSLDIGLARVLKFVEENSELNGLLRKRLRQILILLVPVAAVEAVLLFMSTDVFARHPAVAIITVLCFFASLLASHVLVPKGLDRLNFWASCISVASFSVTLFWGLFPYAIVGSQGSESITLAAAAAGPESQAWGLGGSLVVLPLLAIGQGIAYYFVNKYYKVPDTDINY